jgi:hypothetical protein
MNERIRELAEQAELNLELQSLRVEKFAKLIVSECMDVLDPGENQLIARFQARQWLAEHFGDE